VSEHPQLFNNSNEEGGDGNEEDEHEEVVIGIGRYDTVIHAVEEHDDIGNNRDEQGVVA
jgi:hypothetical protein